METIKLPYEFHVTVEATETNTEAFRREADELGVKAIVLDLGINHGNELSDYMTSSTSMLETDEEAFSEMYRISFGLMREGFNVIRNKIETAPWHPNAPQTEGEIIPDGPYFEAHLAVACPPEAVPELRAGVQGAADRVPMHLSRNAFKPVEAGKLTIMATLRDYEACYSKFSADVQTAQDILSELGFELKKPPITEFALYDSNTDQDNVWMNQKHPKE